MLNSLFKVSPRSDGESGKGILIYIVLLTKDVWTEIDRKRG
jgi:hypothetical protein